MEFFFEKIDNKLDAVSFFLEFERKLNKDEQNFFIFFLELIKNKKTEESIVLKIDTVLKELGLRNREELIDNFNKLTQKNIKYGFVDKIKKTLVWGGTFPIISSLKYSEDKISISPAMELSEAYKSSSFFYKVHLITLIKFKLTYSIKLYQKLINYMEIQKSFEISVNSIKELFELIDSYERFYDFEKNVLEPAVKEINDYSEYSLTYEKIKENDGKTNKIVSLKFSFYNRYLEKIQKESNKLFSLIKEEVVDFELILNTIKKYLELFDYKYVKDNLSFALQHCEGSFDKFFLEALEKNYAFTYFQAKTIETDEKYSLLVNQSAYYSNILKLESELYKQLSNLKFYYDFDFISALHQFKIKNSMEYSNEEIKIFVEYNKIGESHIKIYRMGNLENN